MVASFVATTVATLGVRWKRTLGILLFKSSMACLKGVRAVLVLYSSGKLRFNYLLRQCLACKRTWLRCWVYIFVSTGGFRGPKHLGGENTFC